MTEPIRNILYIDDQSYITEQPKPKCCTDDKCGGEDCKCKREHDSKNLTLDERRKIFNIVER